METKSLENVWIDVACSVSCYGKTKTELRKSQRSTKCEFRPTRCVTILDEIDGLKDHYWLMGTTYLAKGQEVMLSLKMSWVQGYGYRVIDWKYI